MWPDNLYSLERTVCGGCGQIFKASPVRELVFRPSIAVPYRERRTTCSSPGALCGVQHTTTATLMTKKASIRSHLHLVIICECLAHILTIGSFGQT